MSMLKRATTSRRLTNGKGTDSVRIMVKPRRIRTTFRNVLDLNRVHLVVQVEYGSRVCCCRHFWLNLLGIAGESR